MLYINYKLMSNRAIVLK